MGATTGLVAQANYAGAASDSAAVDLLINMLPNPDVLLSNANGASAANGKGANHLDEMSPGAAAQLRVELLALKDAIDTTNTL
jgi:hypothetical protein